MPCWLPQAMPPRRGSGRRTSPHSRPRPSPRLPRRASLGGKRPRGTPRHDHATRPGHAAIIGFGLMGCDIAAIFLAGGWRVTAVEPDRASWPARLDRVSAVAVPARRRRAAGGCARPRRLDGGCRLRRRRRGDRGGAREARDEACGLRRARPAGAGGHPDRQQCLRLPHHRHRRRLRDPGADGQPALLPPRPSGSGGRGGEGEQTQDATCERLAEIMARLGRVPIRVARDVPGFLANRIQHAMVREAFNCIDEGLATPEDVDKAVRSPSACGSWAPGRSCRRSWRGSRRRWRRRHDLPVAHQPVPRPGPTIMGLVEAGGKLGAKTGEQRFWSWTPESTKEERGRSTSGCCWRRWNCCGGRGEKRRPGRRYSPRTPHPISLSRHLPRGECQAHKKRKGGVRGGGHFTSRPSSAPLQIPARPAWRNSSRRSAACRR